MFAKEKEIIVRKFQETDTVWISENYLCKIIGCKISDYLDKFARPNYKKSLPLCHRSKDILPVSGKSWRYARMNGQFYYDYDFIPDRKDTQFRSKLGDKDTLIQQAYESTLKAKESVIKQIGKEIDAYVTYRINNLDIRLFQYYQINGVCKFNHQKARELAESLTWARTIKSLLKTEKYKEFGIDTQAEFYEICASALHKKALEGMKITTGASLRKKLHYFPENEDAQHEYLVSNRYSNENARRLGKEKIVDTETGEIFNIDIHQALILDLWMNPGSAGKGSKLELWEDYKSDLKLTGNEIEPLSYSTFCHYTNSYDIRFKTARERHGEKYFNNMYLPYITSKKLMYANSLWCADGSGTIRYKFRDNKGVIRNRNLYIMMVSDVATGKIVGSAYAPLGESSETPELVRTAMLNALRNTDRREVMEFVSDNHGAFTSKESKEFLESVCRHVRNIQPENSQANYAETQFRLFKKRLRRLSNWVGSSWAATSIENIADPKQININDLPTYQEAIQQLEAKIDEWNNSLTRTGISRSQLYSDNLHPEVQEIDDITWRRISGNLSIKEITKQRGTIVLEKKGIKIKFDVPDYEVLGETIQEHFGYANLVKTHIYWDDECADIYTEDRQYMFTCYKTPEASISTAEADAKSIEAFETGMGKKVRAIRKADIVREEVNLVSKSLRLEYKDDECYDQACIGGGKVKESYNEIREAAMEKRIPEKKSKPQKQVIDAEEAKAIEEYREKKKKLYYKSIYTN